MYTYADPFEPWQVATSIYFTLVEVKYSSERSKRAQTYSSQGNKHVKFHRSSEQMNIYVHAAPSLTLPLLRIWLLVDSSIREAVLRAALRVDLAKYIYLEEIYLFLQR